MVMDVWFRISGQSYGWKTFILSSGHPLVVRIESIRSEFGASHPSFLGFRLGFVIDFLSHAVVIGFMAGAAVTIGLQQLKSLLGYKDFTGNSDIISVFKSVHDYSSQVCPHRPRPRPRPRLCPCGK